MITSLQNPARQRSHRLAREPAAPAAGIVSDRRHTRNPARIEAKVELAEVFVCPTLCGGTDAEAARLLDRLGDMPVRQTHVSPAVFERLAFGQRAEGIVAVARPPQRALDDLRLPACPLVAVLEGVEKPGNVGAVLRSADGAGVSALIVANGATDLYNPNTIRASLGTIFSIPVCTADSAAARDWLAARRIPIFAARVDAATDYTQADFTGPAAIVLGSEATGLSAIWCDIATPIRLPMRGAADSLNVSAAAAVLFYEALRQRGR